MSTKTTPPTNGKAVNATPNPTTTAKIAPITTEVKKPEPGKAKEPSDLPPLEDRLFRLDQLFEVRKQYNKLQESLQKLAQFQTKSDGETSSLTIRDDNRNDFTTYHPTIIAEVVDFLKAKIKDKMKAIEPQLKW